MSVTILTLAIGANTIIFSVISSVLLNSLRFRNPGSLVTVRLDDSGVGLIDLLCSVPERKGLQSRAGVFEGFVEGGDKNQSHHSFARRTIH